MSLKYDPSLVKTFYDSYGEKEWTRLIKNPAALVSFYIHQHYLRKYVAANASVLEVGAGAGRFTIELAKLNAVITVGDISSEQLRLNQKYVAEYDCEASVKSRLQLDITDLSMFEAETFDILVCYGGALSYVLDQAYIALEQMLRALKPQGYLLLSVMSLIGTTQAYFEAIATTPNFTRLVNQVNLDGLLDKNSNNGHQLKMYRAKELRKLLESQNCEVVAMSASNCLSLNRNEFLEQIVNTDSWQDFLNWELDFCREEGCLNGGTHIISVVRKSVKV
jgi:2-polyprenyl-3-methyl-5-hydroxy-6-metoxy-1,4-benzoquinol methylase